MWISVLITLLIGACYVIEPTLARWDRLKKQCDLQHSQVLSGDPRGTYGSPER